jgi:sporulation protein YlmC with PRC-barrel domain
MDIPIHANVSCYDGVVGKSSYIIFDLVTEQATHFVVKTKKHDQQFLVPLDKVMDSDRTVILLDCHKDDVFRFPLFQETYFNGHDAYESSPPVPSLGIAASYTLYHPYRTAESGTHNLEDEASRTQLAVNKGAKVLATDGEVGKIDEVIIDPESHRVTHLVLRQHNLLDKWIVTIPVSEIENAEMDAVYLKLDKHAVKELPTVALKKFPWEV